MTWFIYIECVLLPLTIVLEILALALLYRHKNKKRNKHQLYIIACLCTSELNGALALIVNHIIKYSRVSPTVVGTYSLVFVLFIKFTHYSTMTILTIDRFLVLNGIKVWVFFKKNIEKKHLCRKDELLLLFQIKYFWN